MISDQLKTFVAENRRGVLTTFRRSGAAQMSIVTWAGRHGVPGSTDGRDL